MLGADMPCPEPMTRRPGSRAGLAGSKGQSAPREADLLGVALRQAVARLRPGGAGSGPGAGLPGVALDALQRDPLSPASASCSC